MNNSLWVAAIIASLAGMLGISEAKALTPRESPRIYAAYGPLQLCSDKFVINVREGEALHLVGDIARIINDQEILAIKFADDAYGFMKDTGSAAAGGGTFSAQRFSGVTPDAGNTVSYAAEGLSGDDIRYRVSSPDGGDAMIVGATSFSGGAADRRLLDRIRPAAEQAPDCLPLLQAMGYENDAVSRDRVKPNYRGWAEIFPEKPDEGPAYYCIGGVGFAVQQGESLRRQWSSLKTIGTVHIVSGGSTIKIERRGEPLRPVDANNPREHPMSLLRTSEITYYPSRGVGPPYAPEGERELGSWGIDVDVNGASRSLQISFPASEKTGAGFAFLERLEFIDDNDARCGTEGASR